MPGDGIPTIVLPYTHFTVVHRPDRRFAASTAVCIDGSKLVENVDREDDWNLDPRIPANQQAGQAIYADNDLDRGHLVRRLDPVWGTATEADTFHFTNAAPQQNTFNQGKKPWLGLGLGLGLENFLLEHAAKFDRKLSVFTGPVLHDSDPPYRGIQVPLRFWKVAAHAGRQHRLHGIHPRPEPRPQPGSRTGTGGGQGRPATAGPLAGGPAGGVRGPGPRRGPA